MNLTASVTVPAIALYMFLIPVYLVYEIHRLGKREFCTGTTAIMSQDGPTDLDFCLSYEPQYAFWEIVVRAEGGVCPRDCLHRPAGMAAQVMVSITFYYFRWAETAGHTSSVASMLIL